MLIALSRRHVWDAASKRLEASGYSMLSWGVLAYLLKCGPATQRAIAQATGQHPAGVSRLIDEMEGQGLVSRRRDDVDRRRARVAVARAGRTMFKAAHPLVTSSLKEALRGLSAAEQRELDRLLRKLLSVDGAKQDLEIALRVTPRAKRASAPRTTKSAGR